MRLGILALFLAIGWMVVGWLVPHISLGERAQGGYDGDTDLTEAQVENAKREARNAAQNAEEAVKEAIKH